MRFCPFCAQENADDADECGACGKKLPVARPAQQRTPLPPPSAAAPKRRELKPLSARPLAPLAAPKAPEPPPPVAAEPEVPPPPPPKPARKNLFEQSVEQETASPAVESPLPNRASRPTVPARPAVKPSGTLLGLNPVTAPKAPPPAKPKRPPSESERAATVTAKAMPETPPVAPILDDSTDPHEVPEVIKEPPPAEPVSAALAISLPAMPAPPPGKGLIGSVKYLLPLARALWARRQAGQVLRNQLVGDQRVLDQVLRELGRTAREVSPDTDNLSEEMDRVRAEEARVASANADLEELAVREAEEKEAYAKQLEKLCAQLAEHEADVALADDALKEKTADKRRAEAERARLDAIIRELEKKAGAADARAAKADATPPEKGGGPNTAANARDEAERLRKEATAQIGPRDEARGKAEALTGPVEEQAKKAAASREQVVADRRALADADRDHKRSVASVLADRQRVEEARAGAEREISQRFVAAGTLIHLQRPAHASYEPLYVRIDELEDSATARETQLARLETERRSFDRGAAQRGLIVVGTSFTIFLLGILALIVFAARC